MMNERIAQIERKTRETEVKAILNLDGTGEFRGAVGVPFFEHMLDLFTKHGLFDLTIEAKGDLEVDFHHTVEDVGITLGMALARALGGGEGIVRMGHAIVPMDEALALAAVDLSGRGYAAFEGSFTAPRMGGLGTDLVWHFLDSLARNGGVNLHARILAGANDHHKAEALFKALGRALDQATRPDPRLAGGVPSTKGTVEVQG